MKTYLVGGAVRDGLLGRPPKERDWVVVGATADHMLTRGFQPVGRDFPVFLHPRTGEQYALARTERKTGPGHADFVCYAAPCVTLEEDLRRRDLTINAMAQDGDRLIDPYDGGADLRAGVLKHISPAFVEDPLRVFRVARFAAELPQFRVADATLALMASMDGELSALAAERVWAELEKAAAAAAPARFFDVLGALRGTVWFADLDLPATAALFRRRAFRNPQTALAALGWVNDDGAAVLARLKAPRLIARAARALALHGRQLLSPTSASTLLDALTATAAFRQGELHKLVLGATEDCSGSGLDALRLLVAELARTRVDATPGYGYGAALRARRHARIAEFLAGLPADRPPAR